MVDRLVSRSSPQAAAIGSVVNAGQGGYFRVSYDQSALAPLAPWLGVLVAAAVGALLGGMHAVICNRPRVNYVAVGISMWVLGTGIAFPTVPEGLARIRTIMTATHTKDELQQALEVLKRVGKRMAILQ